MRTVEAKGCGQSNHSEQPRAGLMESRHSALCFYIKANVGQRALKHQPKPIRSTGCCSLLGGTQLRRVLQGKVI